MNNNIPIDQADPVTVGHIWLDVSEYPDKSQMFKHVCGVAYTTTYKRRDGTWSYGIRLTEDICNTESLLCRCIEQLVHDAQNSNDSMDKIAKYIDRTIHDIMSCIYDETTVLIYKTTKDIEQLLINERGRFYRHCGVLTLNREGRRAAKRSRHRPQPKQPSLGFA